MSTDQPRPAMTMREISDALGYTTTGLPRVSVEAARYEVSLLPADDINRKYFTLFVDRTRAGQWVVNDGHGGYDVDGDWAPGLAVAHEFDDLDAALDLARRLAPNVTINGHTAADAYRRTHPAA